MNSPSDAPSAPPARSFWLRQSERDVSTSAGDPPPAPFLSPLAGITDEFLAAVSHDLRTPLSTILAWTQTLRMANPDSEKTRQAVAVIESSAAEQGRLISDLLDSVRIHTGKLVLDRRQAEPVQCAAAAIKAVRELAATKSVTIETEFDPSISSIPADAVRLQQIFRNLLINAIRRTPSGGVVMVRSRMNSDAGWLEIQVQDTGEKIQPDLIPYLFQPLQQENPSTKRTAAGLGLWIARSLVEMHGGALTVESPNAGKGMVFTAALPVRDLLPAVDAAPVSLADPAPAGYSGRPADLTGLRVLVVDDDDDSRQVLSEMLRFLGAQVEQAASAEDGFAAIALFKPAVLLSDIALDGDDGLRLIRRIRELKPGQGGTTPAAALTAYTDPGTIRQSLEAGFDAHLAKPADVLVLSHLIARLARRGPSSL
jgi:CheY-like chemotaxis protein